MLDDDATPFTRADARAVLGPMVEVLLKSATLSAVALGPDRDRAQQTVDEFSAAANRLVETLHRRGLLSDDGKLDGR